MDTLIQGGHWEQHCEGHVTANGFIKCSPWRSCYFHHELKLFLITYVDDFKLAGPADKLAQGWKLLQSPTLNCPKGIEIDPPTAVGRYLGCEHRLSTQLVGRQGELPAAPDPPPPKVKKNAPVQTRVASRKRGATQRPSRLSHASLENPNRPGSLSMTWPNSSIPASP
eukprot:3588835-Pyramimonas_sp.AAC.1